ncbi:YhcN/YlaJ family sporulation lipoprotein [Psychrobacillus sp. FJAT-51614]|uniref:YhcN/YlaJ family sporulation lipoprotein n=1 Tax=Psychrobacillus mangrovi TaxID=3117745 RepID=A0ABU8F3V0_9BACI
MHKIITVLLLFFFLSACSDEAVHTVYPSNTSPEIEEEIKHHDSIKGFQSVVDKNNVLVAIDIKRMSRFNKEKIEKKITKALEKKFPDKEVLVTGDLKVKWEIEKIIDQKLKSKKLTKSIEEIKSLSKEET